MQSLYVFDTSSLIVLFRYFYPDNFPSLWQKFNQLVDQRKVISVREAKQEIFSYYDDDNLKSWSKNNKNFFSMPDEQEARFIAKMFSDFPHFQDLVTKKDRLKEKPVADPFVIAKAHVLKGCAVSEEKFKKNAAKIPNACNKFDIPHKSLKEFMKTEGWRF